MATRLGLYNGALRHIGERTLDSLSENREPRRVLDDVWDQGAIDYCLEQGFWNFAIRTIEITYSPSVEPDFGYRYAFDKPNDFVRTAAVCQDEWFNVPLTAYSDEALYWFADITPLYIRYISDDESYGNNMADWPMSFTKWVELYLATEICERLTQNASKLERLERKEKKALVDARSKDAMNQPTVFPPQGSWVSARRGGFGSGDRGRRGRLIG